MNTHRLATVATLAQDEIRTTKLLKVITDLTAKVQEAINSPNESTQRAVQDALSNVYALLTKAPSNDLSPGLRESLSELVVNDTPATELIGQGLLVRLEEIFEVPFTSIQTLDRLRKVQETLSALNQALEALTKSLADLSVSPEALSPGESVVGMTIPRAQVEQGMRPLIKELLFFERFNLELSECLIGHAEDPKVSSLHSTDFGIDVETTVQVAGAFAFIVRGILTALQTLEKWRELKQKAEELNVDTPTVDSLTKKSEESMKVAIDEISAEVFQECKLTDEGRMNELKTAIKFKINGLANRIEKGFTFEVRTKLPAEADAETSKAAQAVAALSTVRFLPISGPRLLALPEAEDRPEGEDELTQEPGVKKGAKKKSEKK